MPRAMPRPAPARSESLESITAALVKRFRGEIDSLAISGPQQADERAAALAGESGFDFDAPEFDHILAALCDVAGKAFPGDWG
jgi:hypothetical protein